ncbi:hypothetical protein PMI30_04142 [Pseudomonas sp. GM50]|nr:hypothetical protein PMI30_04142 [Pseudomonas sp. GM50]
MHLQGARQSFSGSSKLCKPEERQDNHDDHNDPDDVDDVVHEGHLSTWTGLRHEGATNTRYCTFARNSIRNTHRLRSRRNLGLTPGKRATDSFSLNVRLGEFRAVLTGRNRPKPAICDGQLSTKMRRSNHPLNTVRGNEHGDGRPAIGFDFVVVLCSRLIEAGDHQKIGPFDKRGKQAGGL